MIKITNWIIILNALLAFSLCAEEKVDLSKVITNWARDDVKENTTIVNILQTHVEESLPILLDLMKCDEKLRTRVVILIIKIVGKKELLNPQLWDHPLDMPELRDFTLISEIIGSLVGLPLDKLIIPEKICNLRFQRQIIAIMKDAIKFYYSELKQENAQKQPGNLETQDSIRDNGKASESNPITQEPLAKRLKTQGVK